MCIDACIFPEGKEVCVEDDQGSSSTLCHHAYPTFDLIECLQTKLAKRFLRLMEWKWIGYDWAKDYLMGRMRWYILKLWQSQRGVKRTLPTISWQNALLCIASLPLRYCSLMRSAHTVCGLRNSHKQATTTLLPWQLHNFCGSDEHTDHRYMNSVMGLYVYVQRDQRVVCCMQRCFEIV